MNKKSIIFLIIILLGLVLTVWGALNYQNILSHAGSTDYTNFNVSQVKNGQENPISCDNNGNCQTQFLHVKLQINNLDQLSQ